MQNFQAIAQANPGPDGHPSRNSGEPGYKASVDYVATLMRQAGYNVTIQTYTVRLLRVIGVPHVQRGLADRPRLCAGHGVESRADLGSTTAAVQPAGGIIIPPTRRGSTSGCDRRRLQWLRRRDASR